MKLFLALIRCYRYTVSSTPRLSCRFYLCFSNNPGLAVVIKNIAPMRVSTNGVLPV